MTFTLQGATLLDCTGADPVRGATVVVDGERIDRVGGATRGEAIDLTGLTLLPGLIDAHVHLGLVDLSGAVHPPAVTAARIFRICEATLQAGFTTVRDAGGVDGGVAQATASGLIPGPRILPAGPILHQTGGHGDLRTPFDDRRLPDHPGLVRIGVECDGPDAVRRAARDAFRKGATQIKVCVSGGVVSYADSLEDTQFTVEELRAAVEEADARGTYVMAHAHALRGIQNGLEAGVRCFEHATFLDAATAQRIAGAGAYVVPTMAVIQVMRERWREWGLTEDIVERLAGAEEAMARATKLAYDAGVKVGSGSDILGAEQDRRGLELVLKSRILGPKAAIESATRVNAEILQIAGEVGTVTAGKLADLVAFDGDPLADPEILDDPSRVVLVVQRGRIVKDARK